MVLRKGKGEAPAGYRRELLMLINDPHHRVRENRTHHTVHHHCPYRHLPLVRLVARFTVDQVGKQVPVPVCKGYLRDIPPLGLGRQKGKPSLLFQLLLQLCQIVLLFFQLPFIFQHLRFRLRNFPLESGDLAGSLAYQPRHPALFRFHGHLQLIQVFLFLHQPRFRFLNLLPGGFKGLKLLPVIL